MRGSGGCGVAILAALVLVACSSPQVPIDATPEADALEPDEPVAEMSDEAPVGDVEAVAPDEAVAADDLAEATEGTEPEAAGDTVEVAPEVVPPDRPLCPAPAGAPTVNIHVDPAGPGRVFDGLGAISSAGNSRLLIDYPEPVRGEILDFLFMPGRGAALQVLKVEIPGDMNSTSGSEASHMHSRDDLDCHRGYEWWLMKEAKARNPDIRLAALPWGSPGWTGVASIYTQDLIDYLVAWLDCAGENGLDIDYMGGRNETFWDIEWTKAYKAALVSRGSTAKLVMADTHQSNQWLYAMLLAGDPAAAASVDVLGVHYPCYYDGSDATWCDAPDEALALGVPIWASEQGGDPAKYARILTRGYVEGRLTGFQHWPMMGALPEGIPFHDAGLVLAGEPWSGSWHVATLAWTFAHVTWFTSPGWRYLDGASGHLAEDRSAGAYATLVSPDGSHATALLETTTAAQETVVEIDFAAATPGRVVHVWTSVSSSPASTDHLVHACDLDPGAGLMRLGLAPGMLYTLTTISGQERVDPALPAAAAFPLPYQNGFDADAPGGEGRYLASNNGAFEVVPCGGGRPGRCVRQMASARPKFWGPQVSTPLAVIGDSHMTDYRVVVDVMPEADGTVAILGRHFDQQYFAPKMYDAYVFLLATGGDWSLGRRDSAAEEETLLASGKTEAWPIGTWRTLELSLSGTTLRAAVDGKELGTATDAAWSFGLAGIGVDGDNSGFVNFQFDNLGVLPL